MKRKLLIVFLSIVCCFCLAFGLTACNKGSSSGGTTDNTTDNEQTDGGNEQGGSDDEGSGGGSTSGGSTDDGSTSDGTAHTHKLVKTDATAATCSKEGNIEYWTCSDCGKYFSDGNGITEIDLADTVIAKIAHISSAAVREYQIVATCTAEGSYDSVIYCAVCKAEISRTKMVIAKKEHTEATPVKENVAEATCTEDGSYDSVIYCAVCEAEISREKVTVTAEGHKWDSGKITTAATATTSGTRTYTCTVCGATKTSTLAATGNGGSSLSPSEYAAKMVSTLNSDYGLSTHTSVNASAWSVASSYYSYLAQTIKTSNYDYSRSAALNYTSGTQIGIAIGYNSYPSGAFYSSSSGSYVISGMITLPGGYVASAGSIKPAFSALQEALGVEFVDGYTGLATSANLDSTNTRSLVSTGAWGTTVDVATTTLDVAVSEASTNANILNLADYLDDMPNFKKYLEDNPSVYLSLLQYGMSTTDGSGAAIYVAPYNDYYDDVLQYCLIRQDWVEELLDYELSYNGDTYEQACASSTSVSGGWMGMTGSYSIETSKEDGSGDTFIITKNYDVALMAVKDTSTDFGMAYKAITGGEAYTGASGNIVDIMNEAIAANNGVTGKQLATLYRAYIDVAYQDENGNMAYAIRSDLFNGYSAAWDVDDLVAMLRIVKTNSQNVGLESCSTQGIFPRDATNSRTPDIISLAAQLYGERGADSDYEFTYIDSDGKLQDARANASFWQCLENFGELASEGLVYGYYNSNYSVTFSSTGAMKGDTSNPGTGFMMYDYPQTQTTQMYDTMCDSFGEDYMFGAINTPVSKWDVDGDDTKEEIMRFTESKMSTRTAGLAVAASVANDSNKLAAVLAFIDYLYSNDGQIIMSYGIQSTNGNTNPNGTWYGNEVTSAVDTGSGLTVNGVEVATLMGGQYVVKEEYESMYFAFTNKLYTGYLYKGKMYPIVTDELYESFLSLSDDVYNTFKARGSYSNYTRYVLGLSLPVGVYNRSQENQLSAVKANEAVCKVGVSLANGTIKQLTNTVDSSDYWYTAVPASLPFTDSQSGMLTGTDQNALRAFSGTNMNNNSNFYSIFHHIIWEGYTGKYSQQGYEFDFSSW